MPLEADFDRYGECPYCGVVTNGIANMTDTDLPEDGDVSICMDCGILAVVSTTAPTGLRRPTADERSTFLRDPDIQKLLWAWQIVDQQRRAAQRRNSP